VERPVSTKNHGNSRDGRSTVKPVEWKIPGGGGQTGKKTKKNRNPLWGVWIFS